jgi:hypothetical protein
MAAVTVSHVMAGVFMSTQVAMTERSAYGRSYGAIK